MAPYHERFRRAVISGTLLIVLAACVRPAWADDPAVLYRIFLRDGSTLVSYGEFARVVDRVVFSMPIGPPTGTPALQLVTIPASSVDWTTTERYADSARAAHYAATRGDAEFAALSAQVAWALNEVALTTDPRRRLDVADRARRALAEWARRSYGYRAHDVAELSMLLDEVISELRAAAGQRRFELSLVANVGPPAVPLLPPPTLRETIEQVLTAARVTPEPGERLRLLRTAIDAVDEAATAVPEIWAAATRARAASDLAEEERLETAYAELATSVLKAADERARRADVRRIQALIGQVLGTDEELGRRRPQTVSALLQTLDVKLDATRRLRLARDHWAMRVSRYREYRRGVNRALRQVRRVAESLEDIRALAGPDADALRRLEDRVAQAEVNLTTVAPPEELQPVHALFTSALTLAANACRIRGEAVAANDMREAWDASAAAAGALMLLSRAGDELDRFLKLPELR